MEGGGASQDGIQQSNEEELVRTVCKNEKRMRPWNEVELARTICRNEIRRMYSGWYSIVEGGGASQDSMQQWMEEE
jgi:hypothetical protein